MTAATLAFVACDPEKLEKVQVLPESETVAPVLYGMELVDVSQANYDSDDVVTFSWSAADFGVATAIDYAIYMSSDNYSDMVLASGVNSTSYSIDYRSLYNRLIGESYLGLPKGEVSSVPCYVTASVGTNFRTVTSGTVYIDFDIARISTGINMLYVSGDFNDYHADRDGMEEDSSGSLTYRGLINMKNSNINSNSFYFLEYTYSASNDGERYGDSGGLLAAGGDAIVADPELSWITADLNTGEYSVVSLSGPVRLCGFNGSWSFSNNPELEYDEESDSWVCEADYTSGNFRISINDNWSYTFGPKDLNSLTVSDGSDIMIYHNDIASPLVGGDANITISSAGRYTFRMYYESADCTWHLSIDAVD